MKVMKVTKKHIRTKSCETRDIFLWMIGVSS